MLGALLLGICVSNSLANPYISEEDFQSAINKASTPAEVLGLERMRSMVEGVKSMDRLRAYPEMHPNAKKILPYMNKITHMPGKIRKNITGEVKHNVHKLMANKDIKKLEKYTNVARNDLAAIKDQVNELRFNAIMKKRGLDPKNSTIEALAQALKEKPLPPMIEQKLKKTGQKAGKLARTVKHEGKEAIKLWDKMLVKETPIVLHRLAQHDKKVAKLYGKAGRAGLHAVTNVTHQVGRLIGSNSSGRKLALKTASAGAHVEKWATHKVVQTGRAAAHGLNWAAKTAVKQAKADRERQDEQNRRNLALVKGLGNNAKDWIHENKPLQHLVNRIADRSALRRQQARENVRTLAHQAREAVQKYTGTKNPEFPVAAVAAKTFRKLSHPALKLAKGAAKAKKMTKAALHSVATNKKEFPILSGIVGAAEGSKYPIAAAAGEAIKKAVTQNPVARIARAVRENAK